MSTQYPILGTRGRSGKQKLPLTIYTADIKSKSYRVKIFTFATGPDASSVIYLIAF